VPFVDVVTMLDESIPLTTNEFDRWGNPKQKESYDYILSYSPYADSVDSLHVRPKRCGRRRIVQQAIDAHLATEHFQRLVLNGVRPLALDRQIERVVPI
jgi:hypothetical protein